MKEKIQSRKSVKITIYVIIIFLVFLLFKIIDLGFLKSEITEYPIKCNKKLIYGECKNPGIILSKTTYKLLPNRQEVLYQSPLDKVERLKDCALLDRNNWSCKNADKSLEFGFKDGKYWQHILWSSSEWAKNYLENRYYVSRFEWLKHACSSRSWLQCFAFIANN